MSIFGIDADLQDGEAVRERVGCVPDHQDRAVAEDAEDGLQEARPVVGVKVCGCFVGSRLEMPSKDAIVSLS